MRQGRRSVAVLLLLLAEAAAVPEALAGQAADPASTPTLFKIKPGDLYRQQSIRDGFDKAREVYGAGGYMEFTGYPDLKPTDASTAAAANSTSLRSANVDATHDQVHAPAPMVSVILRIAEGSQYYVNRITFNGNVTTRDAVIRREMQLVEGGIFNTEALKSSVRRLNQLPPAKSSRAAV